MVNKNYTDKNFWDNYFTNHVGELKLIESVPFSDIFDKYLEYNPNKTLLEIGCADSNFLCYLSKKFGYKAYGIDYSDAINRTAEIFKYNGLSEPILYKEDIFTWKSEKKFDLVCSFGLVEHFENLDEIIKKHVELVKPGGDLIITLPHFAHAQYLFHWLIDRENLSKHNTKIMNLHSLKKSLEKAGMKIKYLSYYKTFGFWTEKRNLNLSEKIIKTLIRNCGRIINRIFGYNRPNFIFSPHIVCVATKLK